MAAKSIYIWNDETEIITREIEKRSTFLKIVLKTKNDLFFLTKWIDFYLSFLPPESIIICDNMSDDIDHLAYYDELPDEIVVVRYSGFHNYLHVVNAFPSLYRSLERSSEYFCFLDTDEFLVHIDDTMVPRTDTIVPFLRSLQDIQAIPSCWLNNVIKSKKLFECGSQPAVLESGRMWGSL